MSRVPTIVIVDDSPEVRMLVRTQLKLSGRAELVGEGENGLDAAALAGRLRPDLMLLDIAMPVVNGLVALPQVLEASPGTRVVMYSGLDDLGVSARALDLGAAGFVEKSAPFEVVLDALLGSVDGDSERAREGRNRRTETPFRLLVEAVEDYAIFMLDTGGHISSWNAGAQRSKGYTADEIIGEHFRVFYPPEQQQSRHPEYELEQALEHGRYEEEGWRIRKDGSRFWANVTITAVRDAEGELVGFAKVTRDTTERRELLEQLEQANAQLADAAAQQAQFFAVTAHELRNPVGVLSGAAGTLATRLDDLDDEDRAELAGAVLRSAEQLRRLLDDLLTAARLQARGLQLSPVVVDVAEHLDAVVANRQQSAPGAFIRADCEPGLKLFADPTRLTQMLDNLIENALRHGRPPVQVRATGNGSMVEIVVSDHGEGVSEEMRGRLFERFATGSRQGTGLGLFLVRELARAHGGDATYRPEDSTFVLSLPRR